MSAGPASLTSAINICRVGSGEAPRIASDRFLNPNAMLCPVWGGYDLEGRQVCPDSFNTKSAGCNSALDRIVVESNLRPSYASYVTLNMAGVKGGIFGAGADANPSARTQVNARERMLQTVSMTSARFGESKQATLRSAGACGINAYSNAMAQVAQAKRQGSMNANYAMGAGNASASSCGN